MRHKAIGQLTIEIVCSILLCSSCGNSNHIFTIATDEYLERIDADSVISTYNEVVTNQSEYPLSFQMHIKLHYIKACYDKGISAKLTDKDLQKLTEYYDSSNDGLLHEAYSCIGSVYNNKGDKERAITFYGKAIKHYEAQLQRINNFYHSH